MTLEWPISSQHLGHLYLSVFCKGQQIGTSPRNNMPLWLGHNSATGPGHRGAQSLALQEESGPEPFPGGLDADSDVVPTVRCQQERGVRLSAWVWDVVCVKGREKTESLRARVYMCVCACTPSVVCARSFSHKTNGWCWSLQVDAATSANSAHTSNVTYCCHHWCCGKTVQAYSKPGTARLM